MVNESKGDIKIDGRWYGATRGMIGPLRLLAAQHGRVTVKVTANHEITDIVRPADMNNSARGSVTAVTATTITIGSTMYTLAANAQIHYHGYTLTPSEVPTGGMAVAALDSSGNVQSVWLLQDTNLPAGRAVGGTITAVSGTSITIGGYTLPVSSSVIVRADDQTVSYSDVTANEQAVVHLDNTGTVDVIQLRNQGNVQGTVTQATATTVTVGTTTYTYAPNAEIRYHQFLLTPSQVPTGSAVTLQLNAMGQVQGLRLMEDSNLPDSNHVSGTVTAMTSDSITIGTYDLSLAPSVNITYYGATSLTNTVASGETARATLNQSGQIAQLAIGQTSSSDN